MLISDNVVPLGFGLVGLFISGLGAGPGREVFGGWNLGSADVTAGAEPLSASSTDDGVSCAGAREAPFCFYNLKENHMGKISTSCKKNHWATRLVGAVTAAAYLVTILGAAPAEASFWEDRAAARSRLNGNGGQSPTLLAQLPASQAFSFGSAIRPTSLAAPSPSLSKVLASTPLWARRAVTPYADVRVVREGQTSNLHFFLVMDAHEVYSAQQNVARLLESLGSQGKMVVGVEGTTGAFDLERHRGLLPSPAQEQLTDHLLKKGFINGPEAFGLTAATVPHLWGVEEPALYDANVRAYRDSLSEEGETRSALQVLKKEGFERQKSVFSKDLQKLDREVQAMHEDRGDLGRYATEISRGAGGEVGQQVKRFLDAKALEDKISFPAVEQARTAFIERLSPLLGTMEMAKLVQETTVFRTGGESAKDYYRMISSVGLSKGVPLSAYPAFREYITYVSLADGIDAAQLMEELDALETRAYQRLANGESLSLAEWNKDLRLAERAVEHALTPLEWGQFETRRGELARLKERADSLGFSAVAAETVQTQLPKFAAFFEAAGARNKTLLDNTLAEARRQGANTAVLVTGGFHAPALEKRLIREKISHAVLSPRVAEVPESGAGYLQAFAPTRTPLERLLLGDRLFMNPPSATAVAVRNPNDSFHGTGLALDKATLGYGTALAASSGKLDEFIGRWNQRFGDMGRAVARMVPARAVDVVQVTFAGRNQPVILMATGHESGSVSSDDLNSAVSQQGGKVVDQGQVGGVAYALGGKNVTRVLPEILGALGFMVWLGGTSLSPPALLFGLGMWGTLGGMMLRAMILSSVYWHGMGHAAVVSALGKPTFKQLMHSYESSLSTSALIPFASIFIPGLSSNNSAPSMAAVEPKSPSLGNRVAALAGPLNNLMVVGLVAPFLGMTGISDFTYLTLAAVAGVNLWAAVTSISDFRTAITGLARVFACGVIGVVYGGPNAKGDAMPVGLQSVLDTAVRRTLHRGGQSGGIAAIAVKENGHAEFSYFVEKVAKEGNRRLQLGKLMREAATRLSYRAGKAGYGGLKRVVAVAHTRYGTNLAQPIALNAHPHLGSNHADTILYIGEGSRDDHYERPWDSPRSHPAVKSISMPRGVAIAHNGDDNATAVILNGEKSIYLTNEQDALLSEHMSGFKNPAEGDSPQIATRMERWMTQGSVMASLRLALLQMGLESLRGKDPSFSDVMDRAPSPALMDGILQTQALQSFQAEVIALHKRHDQSAQLEKLFVDAGARVESTDAFWDLEQRVPLERGSDIEGLRDRLAEQADAFLHTMSWFPDLPGQEQKELARVFSDLFLKFFFTGDLRRSGIHLLRRADSTSTYGVMNTTVLEGESAQWLRQNQPFYVWVTEDGKNVAGSSESKAFLGGKIGDSLFRYRLTLRNGEVATLRENRLVIDHVEKGRVAEYDFAQMDRVTEEKRWLDLENSPYVSPSTSLEIAPEKRVREDEEMIPWVNDVLKKDFADSASHNSQTGHAFVTLLMDRLTKKKKGIDLVIVGTEKSFDAGNQHAEALRKLSSMAGRPLNIEVVYAAEFSRKDLVKLRDKGFGADTLVLGVASSGQTANTMYVLESLNKAWEGLSEAAEGTSVEGKTPPHFLVSADIDNPYTEEVLGQGLAKGDPFIARNFVTFPGLDSFHPAEAATVTHKATERLLKEVSVLFADTLAQRSRRWKSGGLAGGVPEAVRQMVDNGDELDRRITGLDANGNPHLNVRQTGEMNDIPDQIQSMANRVQGAFLETLWATAATALFVSLTLMLHQTPASVLLGWLPNGAFQFAQGLPVLASIVGLLTLGGVAWKTKMWKWNPFLGLLGVVAVLGSGLFLGESLFLGVDALGHAIGWAGISGSLGHLPIHLDVSPVNVLNILSYVFFFFAATLGMRQGTGRPLWDRLGGRILVVSDAQHSVARLSAARWRRLVNQRFAWMGLNSVNESSLGRLTHEEALNSNVRGNIYLLGESRDTVGPTVMNYKQLGGSPNGPGRIWRMGIGHKPAGEESPAYSEGYISLAMKGDNPAGDNLDLAEIQDLIQDGPARDTAGMVLALRVAEKMSSIKPLNFVPGMTSSEAKTSTTQQPFAPLSEAEVREVFGLGAPPSLVSVTAVESPLVEKASPSEPTIEKSETPAVPETGPVLEADQFDLAPLAAFLGIQVDPSEKVSSLVTRMEGELVGQESVNVPALYKDALVFFLSNSSQPENIVLDVGKDQRELWTLSDFKQLMEWGYAPEWGSYRVVKMDGIFMVSEGPKAGTPKEAHVPAEIDMYDQVTEITKNEEVVAANHPVHEALVGLAEFLELGVAKDEGDERLADLIEEKMKSMENLQIPGTYEGALPYVLSRAEQRENDRVFSLFWTWKITGPQSLNGYLLNRHDSFKPWDSYFVSFRDTGRRGVRYFRFSPTPHEKEEDEDSFDGNSFAISPAPELAGEGNMAATAAQKDEVAWTDFMRTWITGPLIKISKAMVFAIAIISLPSSESKLTSKIDHTFSQIFNLSAFSQELGTRNLGEITASDPADQSVETSKMAPPLSNSKVSVVNTRVTGLNSYQNHPFEGVRFLGKVEPSVVRVLRRDGVWVNVNANGRSGWVHSKHLFNLKGGKARVVNTTSLFDARPFENVGKRGRFEKGAALEVLEEKGGWTKVRALGSEEAPVWVSGRFLKTGQTELTDSSDKAVLSQNVGIPVPTALGDPAVEKGPLAPLLVPMAPLLGLLDKRRVPVSTSPGALLRQRLLAGARRGWEGENIPAAKAVLAFAENPSDSEWGVRGIRLALGYGALAGGTWAKDRALLNDFRRTREELKGQPLTVLEGRRLTGLARLASAWERASTPSYVEGALQVINLTSAEEETQLLHHWAVALDRVVTHGGQRPVLIAESNAHRDRLEEALKAWRAENRSLGLAIPTGQTRWVYSNDLPADVARRDARGALQSVRMGALLNRAKVDIRKVQSIDLVTGVQPDWVWDRSDLPSEVAVRLIIGVLKDLSLSAPFDSAQNAIRAARKALTAA